ncbi:RICIN domain-containing protein [Microbacterium sp.]|uniref:RICIN domain-containing protein n=1 Tax=Microbacterium sp. TaxID=51671 RepID=UPI003F6F61DA
MKQRSLLALSTVCALAATLVLAPPTVAPASAATATISKSTFRDKVLAMVLGQIGGTLTGYEYVHRIEGGIIDKTKPWVAMPDSAFQLLGGTLGGGGVTSEYTFPSRLPQTGVVDSDDDFIMEFFYQHVMDEYGTDVNFMNLRDEFIQHDVYSWGGTDLAMRQIYETNQIPNNAGKLEYGNVAYWISEPYIETEMLGANYPGMPASAADWSGIPGRMTGDIDNVDFGRFWASAYSEAFFRTDSRDVLQAASASLPQGSWARAIYDRAVQLHTQNPTDWRWAAQEIVNMQMPIFGVSQMITSDRASDINNAFAILAVLYGANDYTSTLKIASLAGYDGDCTAATVTGLMGILKGTAGTPSAFKDEIYDNGNGVIHQVYDYASIRKDYPVNESIDDIVGLFQSNAEKAITANGGTVGSADYTVQRQAFPTPPAEIPITNGGFESGNLTNWTTTQSTSGQIQLAESQDDVAQIPNSAMGRYRGTVVTTNTTASAGMYTTVTGLTGGATYTASAWLRSPTGRESRLYVSNFNGAGTKLYSTAVTGSTQQINYVPAPVETSWARREITFTVPAGYTSARIGLDLPPTSNPAKWGSIDGVSLRKADGYIAGSRVEAESMSLVGAVASANSTASGSQVVSLSSAASSASFTYSNPTRGEKTVRIRYSNPGAAALQDLYVDGAYVARVQFPSTGDGSIVSENLVEVMLPLNAGNRTIKLVPYRGTVNLDAVNMSHKRNLVNAVTYINNDTDYLVNNGIYTVTAKHSGMKLSVTSDSITAGADVIQRTGTGAQAQQWAFQYAGGGYYYVKNMGTGKVLDVSGGGSADGAEVGQWNQLAVDNQLWKPIYVGNGYYRLEAKHSGKVLDVQGGGTASGANVWQWSWGGFDNQLWRLDDAPADATRVVSGATYSLTVRHSGKALSLQSGGTAAGTLTTQDVYSGASTQKWVITSLGSNFYKIGSVGAAGKVLAAVGTARGDAVALANDTGADAQKWTLWIQWDGQVRIVNKATGMVLDIAGGSTANGAQAWQWPLFDYIGANQDWKLELLNL